MNIEQRIQEKVGVKADGNIGPVTMAAIGKTLGCEPNIRAVQAALGVRVDGIMGVVTKRTLAEKLGVDMATIPPLWPKQAEVRAGSSIFGGWGKAEQNLVSLEPAYQLYFDGKPVKTIRVHKLIAPYVTLIFKEILAAYGSDKIHKLGFDQFGGCYNNRSTRSGRSKSMHAWGIAFDWAPDKNTMQMKGNEASLARKECEKFWEIWESYGAISLGRERNYDWMHVQFARL